jgi:hypothetical protein
MTNPQFGCLLGPEVFNFCWFIWEIPYQKLFSTNFCGPVEVFQAVFLYRARHRSLIDPDYSIFTILFFSFDFVHLKIFLIFCVEHVSFFPNPHVFFLSFHVICCLLSSLFRCTIRLNIICIASLVIINPFTLWLSWKVFISLSVFLGSLKYVIPCFAGF